MFLFARRAGCGRDLHPFGCRLRDNDGSFAGRTLDLRAGVVGVCGKVLLAMRALELDVHKPFLIGAPPSYAARAPLASRKFRARLLVILLERFGALRYRRISWNTLLDIAKNALGLDRIVLGD